MARTNKARELQTSNADRARARATSAAKAARRAVPKTPVGLGPAGKTVWTRTWKTCPWLDDSHEGVVLRLCELYDERADLKKAVAKAGYTSTGSMGQPVENPLLATIRATELGINRVERQIGIAVLASRSAAVLDDVHAEQARTDSGRPRLSSLVKEG